MMLIVALVLAVIGLASLVTAVVTSNELIAWVCIGASVIGVLLLIVDALRERSRGADGAEPDADDRDDETTIMPAISESPGSNGQATEDYPDEPTEVVAEAPAEAEAETSAVHVENDVEADAKRD
jgi:hypothetical protein